MSIGESRLEAVANRPMLQDKTTSQDRLDATLFGFLSFYLVNMWSFWIKFACTNNYMLFLAHAHLQGNSYS